MRWNCLETPLRDKAERVQVGVVEDESQPDRFAREFAEIGVTYSKYDKDNKSKGKVEYTWKIEEGTA